MASSKASRFAVWVILGLLIVGLAGFGATGLSGNIRTIGKVGEKDITAESYARALQQELRALTAQTGRAVSFSEAQAAGIDRQVLGQLVATRALDHATAEAGLSVGDEVLRDQLVSIQAFQGLDGQFSRETYALALRQSGLTEAEFEAQLREELARGLLQSAVIGGIEAPPALGETLAGYLSSRRNFTWAELPESLLDAPLPEPDEAALRAQWDSDPDAYTLLAAKRITYAWMRPSMLLDTVEVEEEAIRALYEDRRAEYEREERRLVERLVFASDAAIAAATARVKADPEAFAELVEERGLTLADVDLGDVSMDDLGPAGEAVFAAESGSVVGPVPTSLGPALFRVNAVLPAQVTPLEEAREELRDELAAERARRQIDAEATALDDLLAAGATLEELAAESPMELGTIDWHAGVEDGIAAYNAFREAAEAVTDEDFPAIAALEDGGIFALRLDEEVPPRLQPLEEVRAEVTEDWRRAQTEARLAARAEELRAEAEAGAGLDTLGLTAFVEEDLTRRSFVEGAPPALMERVFAMEPGEVSVLAEDGRVFLVRLDAALPPDPDDPQTALISQVLAEQAAQGIAQDVYEAFARALHARAGIELDQSAISAVHSSLQLQ